MRLPPPQPSLHAAGLLSVRCPRCGFVPVYLILTYLQAGIPAVASSAVVVNFVNRGTIRAGAGVGTIHIILTSRALRGASEARWHRFRPRSMDITEGQACPNAVCVVHQHHPCGVRAVYVLCVWFNLNKLLLSQLQMLKPRPLPSVSMRTQAARSAGLL